MTSARLKFDKYVFRKAGGDVCRPEELRGSVVFPMISVLIQDLFFLSSNTQAIDCARYYRIFAGVALSFLKDTDREGADATAVAATKAEFDAISALMDHELAAADITAETDHCDVKKKVEAMYARLELDCDMVGVKSSLPDDCTSDCWTNMGKEHYFYIPQSDVFNVGELSLDVPEGRVRAR